MPGRGRYHCLIHGPVRSVENPSLDDHSSHIINQNRHNAKHLQLVSRKPLSAAAVWPAAASSTHIVPSFGLYSPLMF